MELKGSRTEQNLLQHLRVKAKLETNIPITHLKRKKKGMNKSLQSSKRPLIMKKSTQNFGSNISMTERCQLRRKI